MLKCRKQIQEYYRASSGWGKIAWHCVHIWRGREGCVWILLNIRIGMVTRVTFLLGMCVCGQRLVGEGMVYRELCVVVSYALRQAESLGLCTLPPIFLCECFQRKIKIHIWHGGRCGHPHAFFMIVILFSLLQRRETMDLLFN